MEKIKAVLYSASRPSDEQFARFERFLAKKYGEGTELEWTESDLFPGGFRLEAGCDVYDWSVGGRLPAPMAWRRRLPSVCVMASRPSPRRRWTLS